MEWHLAKRPLKKMRTSEQAGVEEGLVLKLLARAFGDHGILIVHTVILEEAKRLGSRNLLMASGTGLRKCGSGERPSMKESRLVSQRDGSSRTAHFAYGGGSKLLLNLKVAGQPLVPVKPGAETSSKRRVRRARKEAVWRQMRCLMKMVVRQENSLPCLKWTARNRSPERNTFQYMMARSV